MFKRYFEKKFKKAISNALAVSIVLGNINVGAMANNSNETQSSEVVSSVESKLDSLKKFIVNNPKKVAGAGLLSLTGIGGLGFILSKLFEKNNSNKKEEETKEEKEEETKEYIGNIDELFDENFKHPKVGSGELSWETRASTHFGNVNDNIQRISNVSKFAQDFGIVEDTFNNVVNCKYNQKNLCKKLETYYLDSGDENDRIFNPQKRALLFAIYIETKNEILKDKCLEINNKLSKRALIMFIEANKSEAKLFACILLLFHLGETKFTSYGVDKENSSRCFNDNGFEIFEAIAQGESVVATLPEEFKDDKENILGENYMNYNPTNSYGTSSHSFDELSRNDGSAFFCEQKNGLASAILNYFSKKDYRINEFDVCKYNKSEQNSFLITLQDNAALFKLEPITSGGESAYGHNHGITAKSNLITPTCQFRAWNRFTQRRAMITDLSGCKSQELSDILKSFCNKFDNKEVDFDKLLGKQMSVEELAELTGYQDKDVLENARDHSARYKEWKNFKDLKCCKEQNDNYTIDVKFSNNKYGKVTVNERGEFIDIDYNFSSISSEGGKNAIAYNIIKKAAENIQISSSCFIKSLSRSIKEYEESNLRIPGVKIYRTEMVGTTYIGYIIDDAREFMKWCNGNGIGKEEIKKILVCQNLWFYTDESQIPSGWKIGSAIDDNKFLEKFKKIKHFNSGTENKDSEYVINVNSCSGEWRIYKNDSDKFQRIKEQLNIVREKMSLNVELWVEYFNNKAPFKDIGEIKTKFGLS